MLPVIKSNRSVSISRIRCEQEERDGQPFVTKEEIDLGPDSRQQIALPGFERDRPV